MKTLLAAALVALPLLAAAGEAKAGPVAGVAPGVIDIPTAKRLVAAGVKVVDVRTAEEFAGGHVPGAVNVPFNEMEKRHAEVGPPGAPVLLYCRSGRRSGIATETLKAKGFTAIYDFQAWDRWEAAGGAVAKGAK